MTVGVALRDSGPGVPPEVRGHFFERGFTTRAQRLGLRLWGRVTACAASAATCASAGPAKAPPSRWCGRASPRGLSAS
jgi:hypothetical protein